jgi:hypothetical protein
MKFGGSLKRPAALSLFLGPIFLKVGPIREAKETLTTSPLPPSGVYRFAPDPISKSERQKEKNCGNNPCTAPSSPKPVPVAEFAF